MKGTLGILAALVATLVVVAAAPAAEQTRESYKQRVEPICEANRVANEKIMAGAQKRIAKKRYGPVSKQFIRVSASFGTLVKRLTPIPAPAGEERRVSRWLKFMRLIERRVRKVGKYYALGADIRAAHESIQAERAGISANNISIVFKVRFGRIG
jgi:hypothetical protein